MWKISREAESQKIFPLAAIRSRCVFEERLPPRMHGTFPAGARLWRPPNAPPPRAAGSPRGSAAARRRCAKLLLGTARQPLPCPGRAALPALFTASRSSAKYLSSHLPMTFFSPGLSSLFSPKHMSSSPSASVSYCHRLNSS